MEKKVPLALIITPIVSFALLMIGYCTKKEFKEFIVEGPQSTLVVDSTEWKTMSDSLQKQGVLISKLEQELATIKTKRDPRVRELIVFETKLDTAWLVSNTTDTMIIETPQPYCYQDDDVSVCVAPTDSLTYRVYLSITDSLIAEKYDTQGGQYWTITNTNSYIKLLNPLTLDIPYPQLQVPESTKPPFLRRLAIGPTINGGVYQTPNGVFPGFGIGLGIMWNILKN